MKVIFFLATLSAALLVSDALDFRCKKGQALSRIIAQSHGRVALNGGRCKHVEKCKQNVKCQWAFHCRRVFQYTDDVHVYVAGIRPSNAWPIISQVRCCRALTREVTACQWRTKTVRLGASLRISVSDVAPIGAADAAGGNGTGGGGGGGGKANKAIFRDLFISRDDRRNLVINAEFCKASGFKGDPESICTEETEARQEAKEKRAKAKKAAKKKAAAEAKKVADEKAKDDALKARVAAAQAEADARRAAEAGVTTTAEGVTGEDGMTTAGGEEEETTTTLGEPDYWLGEGGERLYLPSERQEALERGESLRPVYLPVNGGGAAGEETATTTASS